MTSQDLQLVTNGLWQAGAEAIAINGQRLTARSAIRFAGEAILVDFRPLARPYVVNAIGDPAGLRARFVASSTGSYFAALSANYRIRTELVAQDSMTLPGHPSPALRYAESVPSGIPSTPTPSARATPTADRESHDGWPDPSPHGDLAMIPAFGLIAGIVIGLLLNPGVPLWLQPYLPIAVIAALDAVFGGLRAVLDGNFNDKVFVVSFLSNVFVAALIVFLGDQLGVGSQLSTGVVVVLGVRIFSNVAAIRRHLFRA